MDSVPAQRLAHVVLIGGLTVWVANAVIRWWIAVPLGHDEARYALDARDWLAGEPTRFLYAGGGMTAISVPGLALGASERALRLVPLLLGTGFLLAAYVTARRACDPVAAGWTVGVLAGSKMMITHAPELLSDLPSAGLLLLAIAILVGEMSRETGPRWRIVAAAPACAAAFYVRYGSSVPIAVIAGAFLIVAARQIVRHPLRMAVTIALFVLLLVPHAISSVAVTGSITGALRSSAGTPTPSTGLAEYLTSSEVSYGVVLGAVMIIGMVTRPRNRFVFALQLISVAQIVILTLTSHAQARYIYLPTALLVLAGVDAIWRFSQSRSRRVRRVIAAIALAAVVTTWMLSFARIPYYERSRIATYPYMMIAASVIARDRVPGEQCAIVVEELHLSTRIEWYSGCRVYGGGPDPVRTYVVRRTPADAGIPLAIVPGVVAVYASRPRPSN